MAITANKSPYLLTAQGDNLATVFQGRDSRDTTPVCKFLCSSIRVYFGASGDCTLLDKNAVGSQLIFKATRDAGQEAKLEPAKPIWFDGCYVLTLPANSVVFIYVV